MCPPVLALATFAISAASSVVGYQAQQAQYSAQLQQKNENDRLALATGREEQLRLTQRQLQEQQAYGQKVHMQNVEAAEREADVRVSAAGGNVAGISVGNLIGDVRRRAGNNLLTLETNYMNTAQQLQAEQEATVTKIRNRQASVATPTPPSPAGAILSIAGAAIEKGPTVFKL